MKQALYVIGLATCASLLIPAIALILLYLIGS